MFENAAEMSILYDFYGALLTDKQKSVMELFHEDDYTQSEVADRLGVSRQAVHDAVRNCERALLEYEHKLGLVKKFREAKETLEKNNQVLEDIIRDEKKESKIIAKLRDIQNKNTSLIESL